MEKKYKLIADENDMPFVFVIDDELVDAYRLVALKDFDDVKSGDLGGYIESENNLSHDGNCWLYNNTIASGSAVIKDNAKLYGDSRISGDMIIEDNVKIYNSKLYGNMYISGNIEFYDCGIYTSNAYLEFTTSSNHETQQIKNVVLTGFEN